MQCFKVPSSKITKRFDPYYYMPNFQNLHNKLSNLKNVVAIGSLIKSWNRGDGPREGFYTEDYENGIYFIRVNNLKNHTIVLNDIKYINRYIHETKLKRAQVTAGDIVFAISGTKDNLGTVSIIPEDIKEANLNSALVKIILDETKILKEYFCYFFDLSIARTQIEYIGKGAAQNNMNNEEISEILIPLPSIEKQKDIINLMRQACENKQKKEEEAEQLLNNIENLIFQSLEITNKFPKDKKCYCINYSKLQDGRIDVECYQPKFTHIQNLINNSSYEKTSLGNISKFISGFAFSSNDYVECNGVKLLTIKNIKNHKIDLYDSTLLPYKYIEKYNSFKIQKDDIIIAMTGATIGKCAIFDDDEDVLLNQRTGIIRAFNTINPKYLVAYLNSKIFQLEIIQKSCGGAQPNISADEIKKIKIIVPSQSLQDEIAMNYSDIMLHAEKLKQEAKLEFEEVKVEVEKMILGEE